MYGYDVAVFAQSAQVCDSYTEYLHGEKNIYGLINYNRFDGVIIIPLQLTEGNRTEIFDEIVHSLRTNASSPQSRLISQLKALKQYLQTTEALLSRLQITLYRSINAGIYIFFPESRKVRFQRTEQRALLTLWKKTICP